MDFLRDCCNLGPGNQPEGKSKKGGQKDTRNVLNYPEDKRVMSDVNKDHPMKGKSDHAKDVEADPTNTLDK